MAAAQDAAPARGQEEGRPVRLEVQVEVIGPGGEEDTAAELRDNVLAYLKLYQKRGNPNLNDLWLRRLHARAVEDIRRALQPFGYYNPVVEATLEQGGDGAWLARYRIDPGPATRIGTLDLEWTGEGAGDPALQEALEAFPLRKGDVLDHLLYEKGKSALLDLADSLGYPESTARTARVTVDPGRNRADLVLHLDTGGRYSIGAIRLHQDILDENFLRRYLTETGAGDVYSQENLLKLQNDLIESGYFSMVEIRPLFKEARDRQVPVDAFLEPAPRQNWSFGFGYDTDILFNATTRWSHRRLNRAGHTADALLKLSMKESLLRGNYWIPLRNPRTTRLGLSAELSSEYGYDSGDRTTIDLEAGYYFPWYQWSSKLYTGYRYEWFSQGEDGSATTSLFSVGGRVERTSFAPGVYPRSGWYLWSDLRGSLGLVSTTEYVRAHVRGRLYLPLLENGRINLRAEIGTAGVGDFDRYPNSLRFFAGGDGSVRGWDWKDLGPRDDQGEVIGGRQVMTGSLEYDHRVAEEWVAALFVDGGNAFNDDLSKLYYGAGAGMRWLSPVGSIRLDFAWPFNKDNNEATGFSDIHVHFGIEVSL